MSKQDRQGVRTATDLERKYDFSLLSAENIKKFSGRINKVEQDLSNQSASTNEKFMEIDDKLVGIDDLSSITQKNSKEIEDAKLSISDNSNAIEQLEQDLESHAENTAHLTPEERINWNLAHEHSQQTSGNPHRVKKSDVGLGNVDNTSDLDKPVSTAQQTAIDTAYANATAYADDKVRELSDTQQELIDNVASDLTDHESDKNNPHGVTKAQIGLGNVNNTADTAKPVSTAQQTAIDTAYANATAYADKKIADLINGAPSTLDTLKEVSDAMENNKEVVEALEESIGTKASQEEVDSHTENTAIHTTQTEKTNWNNAYSHSQKTSGNPHGVTKSDVGLGNVPNVATNNQTPTFTIASTLATLVSGEKLTVSMGKIAKAITDLINHIANKSNPHGVTKSQVGLSNVDNTADLDKPISTAQQTAIDFKVDKVNGKGLSTNDFTTTAMEKLEGIEEKANFYVHPDSNVNAGTYRSVTVDEKGHVTSGSNPTLNVEQGGTGAATVKGAEYNITSGITESTELISDETQLPFIYQDASATKGRFYWRKATYVWDYIKEKTDNVYFKLTGGTINGDLIIKGNEQFNNLYAKKAFKLEIKETAYEKLDSKYKDGTYYRMWRLRFPSECIFGGKIKVTLYGSYNYVNALGVMSKSICCNFNKNTLYLNVGCYDNLGLYVENDFRISELIWNDSVKSWEILVWQKNLRGNNHANILFEIWGTSQLSLDNALGIRTQAVELTQDTTYKAQKASSTGGTKTVTWAETPVYETPLGLKVSTEGHEHSQYLTTHQDISGKLDTTGDASNVTNAFSTASTRTNLSTGEKLSVSLGKISKWFADLKTVAFSGSYSDLSNKPIVLTGGSQTSSSSSDGGSNVYTFTKSDGTTSTLTVKNGSKGSQGAKGDKGDKGDTGATGAKGSLWYSGTAITGTSTTATVFSSTGITSALVNDYYLNTSTGYVYKCTVGGNASTAKWVYVGSIKGEDGSNATTTSTATTSENGLMSSTDKITLDRLDRECSSLVPRGTAIDAYKNLNTIEFIKVGKYRCTLTSTAASITHLNYQSV